MDDLTTILLAALGGFFVLAFIVLWPVYRFIKKQEMIGNTWTEAYLKGELQINPTFPSEKGASSATENKDL